MAPTVYVFFTFLWVQNIHIRPKIINLASLSLIFWPIGGVRYVCRQKCLTDNGFRNVILYGFYWISQEAVIMYLETHDTSFESPNFFRVDLKHFFFHWMETWNRGRRSVYGDWMRFGDSSKLHGWQKIAFFTELVTSFHLVTSSGIMTSFLV